MERKNWEGVWFFYLEARRNTKHQKFMNPKGIRKLPSKKNPKRNRKSCCIWNAMKEIQPVLPFPHCCLLLLRIVFAWLLQRAELTLRAALGADVLELGKQRHWHCLCQPTALHVLSPVHTATQTHPASTRTLCLCGNAGEQSYNDGFITYSWAILTTEGAELNMWADCCKLLDSGYKLKKPSEIESKAWCILSKPVSKSGLVSYLMIFDSPLIWIISANMLNLFGIVFGLKEFECSNVI